VSYGGKFENASVSPAAFTATTKELVVTGWVENVFAACKFRFRAHLQKG